MCVERKMLALLSKVLCAVISYCLVILILCSDQQERFLEVVSVMRRQFTQRKHGAAGSRCGALVLAAGGQWSPRQSAACPSESHKVTWG